MLRALRSCRIPLLALAVFLVAQPVAGCVALCLFEHHLTAGHAEAGGAMAMTGAACHAGAAGAVQRLAIHVPAPVDTSRAPVLPNLPARRSEPPRSQPAALHPAAPALEPPPPRLA
ncbi:MAG TPA: hypothetical protein VHR43_08740 [Gemmatimonadales bacterium]|nr:hypothetical protein [Gemmatimonadales bacterium]